MKKNRKKTDCAERGQVVHKDADGICGFVRETEVNIEQGEDRNENGDDRDDVSIDAFLHGIEIKALARDVFDLIFVHVAVSGKTSERKLILEGSCIRLVGCLRKLLEHEHDIPITDVQSDVIR